MKQNIAFELFITGITKMIELAAERQKKTISEVDKEKLARDIYFGIEDNLTFAYEDIVEAIKNDNYGDDYSDYEFNEFLN